MRLRATIHAAMTSVRGHGPCGAPSERRRADAPETPMPFACRVFQRAMPPRPCLFCRWQRRVEACLPCSAAPRCPLAGLARQTTDDRVCPARRQVDERCHVAAGRGAAQSASASRRSGSRPAQAAPAAGRRRSSPLRAGPDVIDRLALSPLGGRLRVRRENDAADRLPARITPQPAARLCARRLPSRAIAAQGPARCLAGHVYMPEKGVADCWCADLTVPRRVVFTCRVCRVVLPSIPAKGSQHQPSGVDTWSRPAPPLSSPSRLAGGSSVSIPVSSAASLPSHFATRRCRRTRHRPSCSRTARPRPARPRPRANARGRHWP